MSKIGSWTLAISPPLDPRLIPNYTLTMTEGSKITAWTNMWLEGDEVHVEVLVDHSKRSLLTAQWVGGTYEEPEISYTVKINATKKEIEAEVPAELWPKIAEKLPDALGPEGGTRGKGTKRMIHRYINLG